MVKEQSNNWLDEIDIALIRELELDARQSYEQLASKLSVSSSTVGRRLQRLSDERIIHIATMPNPLALGYRARACLAMNAYPGKIDEVVKIVSSYPNIQHVTITTGRYDIMAWAVFQDLEKLFLFVTGKPGTIPGLANIETMVGFRLIKSSWKFLSADDYVLPEFDPLNLDDSDLKLIRALERNPKEYINKLAAQICMSQPATRKRLQNLIDSGVLRVVSVANPVALGFEIGVAILVKAHPGKSIAVTEEMAKHENVHHIIICTGRFDILAWALFRTSTEMSIYIRNHLGNIPGVMYHETLLQIADPKNSYSLVTALGLL